MEHVHDIVNRLLHVVLSPIDSHLIDPILVVDVIGRKGVGIPVGGASSHHFQSIGPGPPGNITELFPYHLRDRCSPVGMSIATHLLVLPVGSGFDQGNPQPISSVRMDSPLGDSGCQDNTRHAGTDYYQIVFS